MHQLTALSQSSHFQSGHDHCFGLFMEFHVKIKRVNVKAVAWALKRGETKPASLRVHVFVREGKLI